MKIHINKTKNFFLLFFLIILLHLKITISTPLSLCNKGTFSYTPDSSINSKTCSLPEISTEQKIYPASVNKAFFNSYEKCGVCYEMVGPFGAVKLRVVDTNDDSDDSTPFFKLGSEPSFILMNVNNADDLSQDKKVSVSFRMVSCDYSDNIKILTGENNLIGFSFACLVYNNNIPINSIRMKENGGSSFVEIKKTSDNYYYYDKGDMITYPVYLIISSITGEFVNATINTKESSSTFETSGNFYNPDKYYYDVSNLKIIKTSSTENCCSVDFSDYINIYTNGNITQKYEASTENSTITISASEKITNVKFNNSGKLYIKSKSPIRADQFISISLSIKANKICTDCLYISSYDKSSDNKISFVKENTLKTYYYLFNSLGFDGNTFIGIVLYTKNNDIEIGISDIQLMENSNAPSTEICLGNSSDWIPVVPVIPTDLIKVNLTTTNLIINTTTILTTIIPTTNISTNNTDYTYINILNISVLVNNIISVQCEPFIKLEHEAIKIIFIPNEGYNTTNFETQNCFITTSELYTNSFLCNLQDLSTITNGKYKVSSPEDNLYKITSSGTITIYNGKIIYENKKEYIPTILTDTPKIDTTIITPSEKIIIADSLNKIINKGETIKFKINPISKATYNTYGLSEIIFIDNTRSRNALYLKNCNYISSNSNQNMIDTISCGVSNNIIRGNYSTLSSGQDISIAQGKTVNLACNDSYGGSFSVDMSQTVNANISRKEKHNYTLNFKVVYYDKNLKPNDLFPYQVYLYGNRKVNNSRKLADQSKYNLYFTFPNCTMGSYMSYSNQAMNGINCNLPNFVQAGEYSKIVSNGFDVNPNQKINITFPYDFNKSENYITDNSSTPYQKESKSKSKTWIIWLVFGILLAVLVVIVIVAFVMNRKKNKMSADNSDDVNNSQNKIDNSNDSNNGKENNNNNESNNSNKSISQMT